MTNGEKMKAHLKLIAVLLALLAFPLAAQERLEVVPRSSDLFTLTPAAPSAVRQLLFDAASTVRVTLSSSATNLNVALVSPTGARYTFGTAASGFDTLVQQVGPVAGANYYGVLMNPARGTWRLEASSPSLSAPVDVVVNVLFSNRVAIVLAGGGESNPAGTTTALSLAAFDGTTKITTLSISATAFLPDGTMLPVVFHDDGSFPDAAAHDGIYSAGFNSSIEGTYRVAVAAGGTASTGAFKRTAQTTFRASHRGAALDGTFVDAGYDSNNDGLLDGITVAPRLNVADPGTYSVSVRLTSASGHMIQRAFTGPFVGGTSSPQVRFFLDDVLKSLGENGPYAVSLVEVQQQLSPSDFVTADRRIDLGNTAAYQIAAFQHPRLAVAGGTATGIDLNGNGQYDQLRIDLQLSVERAGYYQYSGTLLATNTVQLGNVSGSAFFNVGLNTITLVFAGRPIGTNNVDGPYDLALLAFGAGQSLVAPKAYSTPAFHAYQFEGGRQVDTTPPTLSVSVAPTELWPVDHKMVEIVPTISVSDDKDPHPTVSLVSITSNEGENMRGDGNTSPDIEVTNGRIFLRAERSALDTDRVYTITWSARDASGNSATASATVTVPHDQGKN